MVDLQSKAKLNNGIQMPYLGLGTYALRGKTAEEVVDWAYEQGYRHFDTATYYRNEEALGKAFKKYPREELFVTTKIWPSDFGYEKSMRAFNENLERLSFDYVDQLLIHWPSDKQRTLETWEAFIKIYNDGKAKSIGVSNFYLNELNMLKEAGNFIPATDQVKFTPGNYNKSLMDYCKNNNIQIVAYSPLNEGRGLNNKKLIFLAEKYNKTVAQLILRWDIQQQIITIPKTSKRGRLKENSDIFDFEISESDMDLITKSGF